MIQLLPVLTPIGLLDSTSIIPLCIVVLVGLLAGPRPVVRSGALILGVFATYLACGFLILLGLQSVFDQINTYAARVWASPDIEELLFQILLGVILCLFSLRIARGRARRAESKTVSGMTASGAFLAGAALTVIGLPGAVPYFAAIDLTLRADLTFAQRVLALFYYNIVFVAPLAAIVLVSRALGERGQDALAALKRFLDQWGQRIVMALLMVLGVVLMADGIGWLLGRPLIPV